MSARLVLLLLLACGCVGEDAILSNESAHAGVGGGTSSTGGSTGSLSSTGGNGPSTGGGGASDAPTVAWARSLPSAQSTAYPCGVGTLTEGDAVLAGEFDGDVSVGTQTLTAGGDLNIYLARQSWATAGASQAWSLTGNTHLGANALATNGTRVALVGRYYGSPDLGGGPLLPWEGGGYSPFVSAHDAGGKWISSRGFVGDGTRELTSVAMGTDGDVVVAGWFKGTLELERGSKQSNGGDDALLAHFDPNGELLWFHQYGDLAYQQATAVAYGEDGTIYVAGNFGGTIDFGPAPLQATGGYDIFVAAFESDGTARWSQRLVASGNAFVQALVAVPAVAGGGAWLVGWGDGTVVELGTRHLNLERDVFAARLSPDGSIGAVHVVDGGSGSILNLSAAAADESGRLLLGGVLTGSASIGTSVLESAPCSMQYCNDMVLALFDDSGPLWSAIYGTAEHNDVADSVSFTNGGFYVAGWFSGHLDLGGKVLDASRSTTFIARFDVP